MSHPIRCQCGKLQGSLTAPKAINRGLCYCRDCQAFAHFLGHPDTILDAAGGTDLVQTEAQYVRFHQGQEYLACVQITPRLLRWYARCCNTPIGNTLPTRQVAFVGLIHNCLDHGSQSLDDAFGPAQMQVHTQYAKGKPLKTQGLAPAALRIFSTVIRARLNGSYQQTPFFTPQGQPVTAPTVMGKEERQALKAKL